MMSYWRFIRFIAPFIFIIPLHGAELESLPAGFFNKQFNALIRQTHPHWWGNWNLSPSITIGAIGIIDTNTGTFRSAGVELDNITMSCTQLSESMDLSNGNVRQSGGDLLGVVDAAGSSGSGEISWQFSRAGAMIAKWQLTEHRFMNYPVETLKESLDTLKLVAENQNMLSPDGIAQRFGVITSVIYAKSGLSIGSRSKHSDFQISGDVNVLNSLFSRQRVRQGYYSVKSSGQIASAIWPSEPGTSVDPVPIAFTFASLDGERVIPNWTQPINNFKLNLSNHGSYIVNVELDYRTPQGKVSRDDTLTALSSIHFDDIPLDATDLNLKLDFVEIFSNTERHFRWRSPLGSWATGWRHIGISGFWPKSPVVTVKEEKMSM
ncbi:hypothetical protein [Endozoicomonas sp. SCSIO W0465]|uniref:hypothetical protein n=1 Tax=Endozoicomonas sp. SCSIO W0465 TaxID=2918516 RepID=UPI002075A316|nr:hypothetical protein [Endozoicomonas sp. SCSIO W0465]USE38087.1 hypothetical protein MJO57_07890 [Endozoicomonas sp. SCSIO W0465]